jgi:hypothetical protein
MTPEQPSWHHRDLESVVADECGATGIDGRAKQPSQAPGLVEMITKLVLGEVEAEFEGSVACEGYQSWSLHVRIVRAWMKGGCVEKKRLDVSGPGGSP